MLLLPLPLLLLLLLLVVVVLLLLLLLLLQLLVVVRLMAVDAGHIELIQPCSQPFMAASAAAAAQPLPGCWKWRLPEACNRSVFTGRTSSRAPWRMLAARAAPLHLG
jgi:hypothetical protein